MYEIVKKQSLIVKIVSTLIILYLITTALKFIFRQPETSINDDLMKVASEINKHTPITRYAKRTWLWCLEPTH